MTGKHLQALGIDKIIENKLDALISGKLSEFIKDLRCNYYTLNATLCQEIALAVCVEPFNSLPFATVYCYIALYVADYLTSLA